MFANISSIPNRRIFTKFNTRDFIGNLSRKSNPGKELLRFRGLDLLGESATSVSLRGHFLPCCVLYRFFLAALTVGTVRARHATAYRASRPSILFAAPPDRQNLHRHRERRRSLGGTRPRVAARSITFTPVHYDS